VGGLEEPRAQPVSHYLKENPMKLAKPHLDIGLFTNDIDSHRDFWGNTVGLRYDHQLTFRKGWSVYRYDAHGSVIKVNHRVTRLRKRPASGFATLSIARSVQSDDWDGESPDGDRVRLVTPGEGGVVGIGISISTPDPERMLEFYRVALEFETNGPDSVRCGDSVVTFIEGPGGSDIDDYARMGYRYLTVQVYDADAEMAAVVERGGRVAREAVNFPGVARYGFVADPDGNWIELSARTQLTGVQIS
jgi:lactoylglutathione lyase